MKPSRKIAMMGAAVVATAMITPVSAFAEGQSEIFDEIVFVASSGAKALKPSDPRQVDGDIVGDGFVVTLSVAADDTILGREIELVRQPVESDEEDEPATFTASSTGEVTLNWRDPSNGEVEWTISRDGKHLATTRSSSFTDARPVSDVISEYRIEGSQTVIVDGKTATQPFLILLDVPQVDQALIGDQLSVASRAASVNTDVLQAPAFQLVVVDQQLNTFIPDYAINGPWDVNLCLQAWSLQPGTLLRFAGDNRSFAGPTVHSPSVRTGIDAVYSFQGPDDEYAAFGTHTSGTRLIDAAGNTVAQRKTNLTGIQRTGDSGDFRSKLSTWNHEASDPLCAFSDPIDYELTFGADASNWITLRGWHEQAPSYEFRTKWRSGGFVGAWKNVYTFSNKGFEYLFEFWPKAYVDIYRNVAQ